MDTCNNDQMRRKLTNPHVGNNAHIDRMQSSEWEEKIEMQSTSNEQMIHQTKSEIN